MKKFLLILIAALIPTLIVGCSSSEEESKTEEEPAEETGPKEKSPEEKFNEFRLQSIEKSDELLTTLNESIDGLYTGDIDEAGFFKTISDLVIFSQKNIADIENKEVDSNFFESKQALIKHLNRQHDLFLDAADMKNSYSGIEKRKLREGYLEIKEEQAKIMNDIL